MSVAFPLFYSLGGEPSAEPGVRQLGDQEALGARGALGAVSMPGRWIAEARNPGGERIALDLQDLLARVEEAQPGLIEELLEAAAEKPPAGEDAFAELAGINALIQEFVLAARKNEAGEGDPWSAAYSLVFSPEASQRASALCEMLGVRLEYWDPDTSYEEDVLAYADALNECVRKRLASVPPLGPLSARPAG